MEQAEWKDGAGSTSTERPQGRERQVEEAPGRALAGDRRTERDRRKKLVTPAVRRQALEILKSKGLSERAACQFAGESRRVANYEPKQPAKDQALGAQLIKGVKPLSALWLWTHHRDDGHEGEPSMATLG